MFYRFVVVFRSSNMRLLNASRFYPTRKNKDVKSEKMKTIDINKLSSDECQGIQINGFSHCKTIDCRWQGLSACEGKNIIRSGKNSKGYVIDEFGLLPEYEVR